MKSSQSHRLHPHSRVILLNTINNHGCMHHTSMERNSDIRNILPRARHIRTITCYITIYVDIM